jgi:hypothetical protein
MRVKCNRPAASPQPLIEPRMQLNGQDRRRIVGFSFKSASGPLRRFFSKRQPFFPVYVT